MNNQTTLNLGLTVKTIHRNLSVPDLYERSILKGDKSVIAANGALIVYSGNKTGRSPSDKRIVRDAKSEHNIDWGKVNIEIDRGAFLINLERALDYFNMQDEIYVLDGFAGWDPKFRLKIRIICTRPYHALFMRNMLIVPTEKELDEFGDPDYTIYNAGEFPANQKTQQMSSKTSISTDLEAKQMVILGTEYAGEMKKGVFSIFNYESPIKGLLSMHCSANEGSNGDVSLFFGLSGTGKTTLSADSRRKLIGDDEHVWTEDGVFNIEGGCYAKAIGLTKENEPEIYNAIKFGTVLENLIYDPKTREVDYNNIEITENTRASYPINFIDNAKIPCIGGHPKNIIFLTCDAYGVLPPVSKLTAHQASYHFISGYTAKVAGTEMGVTEPTATFSACFGAAFMLWHPNKYAELLAQKIKENNVNVWLLNTGWTSGPYGVGSRIKLRYTRAIIDSIHDGSLQNTAFQNFDVFGLSIPTSCANVPSELLNPSETWTDKDAYKTTLINLANKFKTNFEKYESKVNDEIRQCGPKL